VNNRRGFVMLTTLWVLTVAGIIAAAAALSGRNGVDAGTYRVQAERARWVALGCARRAQAIVDFALAAAPSEDSAGGVWRSLAGVVRSSTLLGDPCSVELEAGGTRLDVNSTTPEMLRTLLELEGHGDAAAAMTSALLAPRGRPFEDDREIAHVPGFEQTNVAADDLSVIPGRVSLATAPVPVLMAVPGITRETAERVVERRISGTPIRDLPEIASLISDESRSALIARFPEASRVTTPDPDCWVLRSTAQNGLRPSVVVIEWQLLRTGRHVAIALSRELP
jgi:type II secretory pathway component PulK